MTVTSKIKDAVGAVATAVTGGGEEAPAPTKSTAAKTTAKKRLARTEPAAAADDTPSDTLNSAPAADSSNVLKETQKGEQDLVNPPAGDAGTSTGQAAEILSPPQEKGVQAGIVNAAPAPEMIEAPTGVQRYRDNPRHGDTVNYTRVVNGEVRHYPALVGGAPPRNGAVSGLGNLDLYILVRDASQPVENAYDVPQGDGKTDKTWCRADAHEQDVAT